MGLDIVLGLVALVMAISGWRQGFWVQIMRLICLVVGLYAAEPLAIRAEPFVSQHIKLENPAMLQRGLWWVSWALVYTLGSLIVGFAAKVSKWRKSPLQAELEPPGKFDPMFGFLFGIVKAGITAAFILSAVDHYAIPKIEHKDWAKKYVVESKALEYSRKYEPVPKILAAEPVKSMLEIIQERGLGGESTKDLLTNLKIPKEEWDRLYALRDKGQNLIEKGKTAAETASKVLDEAKDLTKETDVLKNALRDGTGSKR
ncbi:hypothetical protein GC170_12230 [bacterium]|nr:hypothetical protein [bacterium]